MEKIEFVEDASSPTRIKVVGVGGGGCNAVDSMIASGLMGVDFCNVNTDLQALSLSQSPSKLHIGAEVTGGMGCGGDPALGERAAQASSQEIAEMLGDCDMIFIAAGLGGGTGTGAAPVIAETAKSMDLLTVAIVTKPFAFEGPQRRQRAEMGLAKLAEYVDTKIVILNDKLVEIIGPKIPVTEAFLHVNNVLSQGVSAISDLISRPGLINVDFMDIRSTMGETGGAVMGVGIGMGENRASEAVKKACSSPLQEKIVIEGARGVLISIAGPPDMTLQEVNEATSQVYEAADPEANVIFGVVIDQELKDEMRVTIIATGFPDEVKRFPAHHPQQERLSSPTTSLDLNAKIKSMMAADEAKGEQAPAAAEPEEPPQDAPLARVASEPAQPAQASPSTWQTQAPVLEDSDPSAAPSVSQAAPAPPRQEPPPEEPDLETPALVRRRKTLFDD